MIDGFNKVIKELNSYRDLQDGWDGDGTKAPTEKAISATISFVSEIAESSDSLMPPVSMVDGDGEVSLYWKNGDNYLEAYYDDDESKLNYVYNIDFKLGEGDSLSRLIEIIKTFS